MTVALEVQHSGKLAGTLGPSLHEGISRVRGGCGAAGLWLGTLLDHPAELVLALRMRCGVNTLGSRTLVRLPIYSLNWPRRAHMGVVLSPCLTSRARS